MWLTRTLRAIAAAVGVVLVWAPPVQAACYAPNEALPTQTVGQFTAAPASLLSQFGDGAQLTSQVRDLAASNPATLAPLTSLLANATPDQQKAIGTALGQAALICIGKDQLFATQIQQTVLGTNNTIAIAALTAVLGDLQIGAAGPGGGGGGGGQTATYPGGGGGGGSSTPFGSSTAYKPTIAPSFGTALACSPADPWLWTVLYRLETIRNGFEARQIALLQLSYRLGPNEGWIALRRNGLALAAYRQLPSDLQQVALEEFANLVATGFYREGVAILTGPGWSVRDLLLPRLQSVSELHRQDFAKALRREGYAVRVPGTLLPDPRPWD